MSMLKKTYYSLKYPFAFKALHSLKYSGTLIKEDLSHYKRLF